MLLGAWGNSLYFDARNLWPDAIGELSCRPITHHPIWTTSRTIYAPRQFGRVCMRACWDLKMRRLNDCLPLRMISKPERMPQSALLWPPALRSPELHRRPAAISGRIEEESCMSMMRPAPLAGAEAEMSASHAVMELVRTNSGTQPPGGSPT